MTPRRISRWFAYLLLAGGAVVFSFPFVWMLGTSMKVNREIYTERIRVFPARPIPRTVSPYVDDTYYDDVEGPCYRELQPRLERLVDDVGFEIPSCVDAGLARREIARGLYKKLQATVPSSLWNAAGPHAVDRLFESAVSRIGKDTVAAAFDTVYRQLRFGPLRVRSEDLQEEELGSGRPFSSRVENQSPAVCSLEDQTTGNRSAALVRYDFRKGDKAVFVGTFDLGFPADRFQRLQMRVTPDDTWHELWLTLEKNGRVFRSSLPVFLANLQTLVATWQVPGPDDTSNKIKTWVVIRPDPKSFSDVVAPNRIRVSLELRRVGPVGALWNKIINNYRRVFDAMPFWRYLRVSLFLVVATIFLTVLSSSFVAYAFARLHWPGRDFSFLVMLAGMMIPGQVTMIPHFLIWKQAGAYNTLAPLWLGSACGSAFFIFLLRQFMKGIPRDLEDAARIDGCGFLRIYWHIILPLIKPSLAAIAIFTFLGTWNDFMGPLLYVADQRLYPLSFGLYAFNVQQGAEYPLMMAGCLLMTLPVVVIFFFAQKYFIQGVTLTGIKG